MNRSEITRENKALKVEGKKRCSKCLTVKPLDNFYTKQMKKSVGHDSWCKDCHIERKKSKEYRENSNYKQSRREYYEKIRNEFEDKMRVCKQCGCEYRRKKIRHSGQGKTFCSKECSIEYVKNNAKPKSCEVYFVECEQCGTLFTARKSKKIMTCSEKCRYDNWIAKNDIDELRKYWRDQSRRLRGYELNQRKCPVCGVEFKTYCKTKKCCSSKCSNKVLKQQKRVRNRIRVKKLNDRLIDKNITVDRLHARDKGICGICGEKVDRRRKHPHPKSATIDHILPIAKGGYHEWSNVQLAHFECNCCEKRDTMPKQRQRTFNELLREKAA